MVEIYYYNKNSGSKGNLGEIPSDVERATICQKTPVITEQGLSYQNSIFSFYLGHEIDFASLDYSILNEQFLTEIERLKRLGYVRGVWYDNCLLGINAQDKVCASLEQMSADLVETVSLLNSENPDFGTREHTR